MLFLEFLLICFLIRKIWRKLCTCVFSLSGFTSVVMLCGFVFTLNAFVQYFSVYASDGNENTDKKRNRDHEHILHAMSKLLVNK